MPRDYASEYKNYHSKDKQMKRRAMRNAARQLLIKKKRARKGDGKDVHHKDHNPMNNAYRNLRLVSKSTNRSKRI